MALELSEKQAISDEVWMPRSFNNWLMGNVLMYKLLKGVQKVASGLYVRYPLTHAAARGGPFSGSTVFDTAKKAILNAARFPWAYYWSGVSYDIEDEVEISGGPAEVDYTLSLLDNAQESLRDYMGLGLWLAYATSQTTYGSNTRPFYGIPDLMNSTSDTSPAYGRINRADLGSYTREGTSTYIWQPYENANALVMSFPTLQLLRRNCMVGDGPDQMPSLYVTTPTLWDKLENSVIASQRHYDEDIAKMGFKGLLMVGGGGTVVWDNKCTANHVIAMNLKKLVLKAHKKYFFPRPVWKEKIDQPYETTQLKFVGCLGTGERRAFGRLTSVT